MDRTDTMSLFVAAIDTGSLSGAARISGVSLSSVSRHLSALEERVGTRLLIRTTRTLALTEAGQRYYDKSRRILTEIDEMEAGLHTDAETPVGRLHVAGPTLFGRFFMLPLLAKFAVMHPRIVMDVILLDRQHNLIEEGIDVAVRIGPMVDSSLIIRKLGALRWIICAAPVYLEQRSTPHTLADLSGHDCLVYSQDMDAVNNELLIVPMIETNQALENLDAIASVPGVDVLLIGPSDLSIELGVPLDYACDTYQRALDKIAAAAAKHGIAAGILMAPIRSCRAPV